MTPKLNSIGPREAVEEYLKAQEPELAAESLKTHKYRLKHFLDWVEDNDDLDVMADVTVATCERFKLSRLQSDVTAYTAEHQLRTFRVFLRWCERLNYVEEGIAEDFVIPTTDSDPVNDDILVKEHADAIVEYLRKYEYASVRHIILEILIHTGMRMGALHSLDVNDWDSDNERFSLEHRPDKGTTLKTGERGERVVTVLDEELSEAIDDYIATNRPGVVDDHDRFPLIATTHGRMTKSSIQRNVYSATRPCMVGDCPVDGKRPETCEWNTPNKAYGCPESVGPHAVRRGTITHYRAQEVDTQTVSDRMAVSPEIIEKHYDPRSAEQKGEQRRRRLSETLDDVDG